MTTGVLLFEYSKYVELNLGVLLLGGGTTPGFKSIWGSQKVEPRSPQSSDHSRPGTQQPRRHGLLRVNWESRPLGHG